MNEDLDAVLDKIEYRGPGGKSKIDPHRDWIVALLERALERKTRIALLSLSAALKEHRGLSISDKRLGEWIKNREPELNEQLREAGILG